MNPYQAYQNNSILTASPEELILMLYNGAIKFCNLAREAIEQKNVPKSHEYIVKAQNIIWELRVTLDKKYPVAEDMERMYEFIYNLLVQANISKDKEKLETATQFIREFRDTWKEAIKKGKLA